MARCRAQMAARLFSAENIFPVERFSLKVKSMWQFLATVSLSLLFCIQCASAQQPSSSPGIPSDRLGDKKPAPEKTGEAVTKAQQALVEDAAPKEPSADELAIRKSDDEFASAYGEADAKKAAAFFTADAEYVDENGNVLQGRSAIENSLAAFFKEHPRCRLALNPEAVRFISPGLAVEDGRTTIHHEKGQQAVECQYTAVLVKVGEKWLRASVRDLASKSRRLHRSELQQLEWLLGQWVDEGDTAVVNYSCKATDNGNYLIRDFSVHIAGQQAIGGTQRIGWDPLTNQFRTWIFDSEGAFSEGLWHRDDDSWVLKTSGVTADGESASSTTIYKLVNEHTMTWQVVDLEIGGVRRPDSEIITLVRHGPAPTPLAAAKSEK